MSDPLVIEAKTKVRWDLAKVVFPIEITIGSRTWTREIEKSLAEVEAVVIGRARDGKSRLSSLED
jgi:hypothetical protein